MLGNEAHPVVQDILDRFASKTAGSRAHLERAKQWLPGGDTRRASFFAPYPPVFVKGSGCRVYDCDGNEYLDLQNNYTSLIHGHADPRVNKVAHAEVDRGVVLGSASEIQYRHAEHLCGRVPSLDMVRYCNSGTEATMFCLRAARAFTGRHDVVKMDGGYHGQHEAAQVNINPDLESDGPPRPWADPWIPPGVISGVKVIPYNDLEAAERVLEENRNRIAALIMEPMFGAGGLLVPRPGYLEGMRELTRRYGVLLVYDEVMVFRLSRGGMQEATGVIPDLTAMGKIIGGGFPVGAFGGRRDVMAMFDPSHPRPVFHSGTFAGNNCTLATGLATLEIYDQPAVERLNRLGDGMRNGFREALARAGIKGQVTGLGSLVNVHWMAEEPHSAGQAARGALAAKGLAGLCNLELINQGVFSTHRGMYSLSTAMGEPEVAEAVAAFERALKTLKPYIVDETPHLLSS